MASIAANGLSACCGSLERLSLDGRKLPADWFEARMWAEDPADEVPTAITVLRSALESPQRQLLFHKGLQPLEKLTGVKKLSAGRDNTRNLDAPSHSRPAPPPSLLFISQRKTHLYTLFRAWHPACTGRLSMDPLTTAAASGLQARMDAFDLLANNLANTSTSGFKADREFYNTYLAPEAIAQGQATVGDSPVVQQHWTDFAQGTLLETGKTTDLALSGSGFFAANGPNGPLYTRSGNFHLSTQGVLVSAQGYPVRLVGGRTLQTQSIQGLQFQPDGQILQDGNTLGQLELADFANPNQLKKVAGAYFQNPDPNTIKPTATTAQVNQGKLETSNAGPEEAAARMITLLRHFEMLQHAIKLGAEMNRQAVQEVARVSA